MKRTRITLRRTASILAALVLGFAGALVASSPASATTFTVTHGGDSGVGSLRQAILDANSAPGPHIININFPGNSIGLISALPPIQQPVSIVGSPGATVNGFLAVGANGFNSQSCVDLAISDLSIVNFEQYGIFSTCGTLTVTGVTASVNALGGLYSSGGSVAISNSTFNSNASYGIDIRLDQVDATATLTSVTTNDNVYGINIAADALGTTATVDGLTATGNDNDGMTFAAKPGSISVTNASASANDIGILTFADATLGAATISVSSSSSTGNNNIGVVAAGQLAGAHFSLTDVVSSANGTSNVIVSTTSGVGSTATLTRVTGNSSPAGGGLYVLTWDSAAVSIVDSEFNDNFSRGIQLLTFDDATATISGTEVARNNLTGPETQGGGIYLDSSAGAVTLLSDLDVTGNLSGDGGGIYADVYDEGQLTISGSRITGNSANLGGAGAGGGIRLRNVEGADATFTLEDSVVSGNDAVNTGGGFSFEGTGTGYDTGGIVIRRTTISDNTVSVGSGGGVYALNWAWGPSPSVAALTIEQSTISGNTAPGGAGIDLENGLSALDLTAPAEVRVANTTISGNIATNVGGGIAFMSSSDQALLNLTNSTVVDNAAESGGGIRLTQFANALYSHTVIANNDGDDPLDAVRNGANTRLSVNWSLIENPDAATQAEMDLGTGNIDGTDPVLGALANNGGPTLTHLPLNGSPLVNAGNPTIVGGGATDQRGFARVAVVIDIGAVEIQALAATGTDAMVPLAFGGLLAGGGILLLVLAARRRRTTTL